MKASVMFKITQNTLRNFTLAEVILMAAMNQLEPKRKAGGSKGILEEAGIDAPVTGRKWKPAN